MSVVIYIVIFLILLIVSGEHSAMENYEEFCSRSLVKLQSEGKGAMMRCLLNGQWLTSSVICIHGRPILSPLVCKWDNGW